MSFNSFEWYYVSSFLNRYVSTIEIIYLVSSIFCTGSDKFSGYFRDIAPTPIVPPGVEDPLKYLRDSRMAVIGTPQDAIEHIERLLKGSGGFGVLLELAHDWADWEQTQKNYELMSRYVIPHFQSSMKVRSESYKNVAANREKYVGAVNEAISNETSRYEERQRKVNNEQ